LLIPLAAALGLGGFMKGHEKSFKTPLWIALGTVGGLCLIIALLGPTLMTFNGAGDARLGESGWNIDALIKDRKSALVADAWRSFIWVALCSAVIWVYHQGKIKQWLLLSGLGIFILADLWAVGRRYISPADFVPARSVEAIFEPRPVDKAILDDPDPYYRVHDITSNPFTTSLASYHHHTIGGYSPAKFQRYQDLIDRYITQGNINVLSMLNMKYLIMNGQDKQPTYQTNPRAMGNAWFVDSVQYVTTNRAELDALDSADLHFNAFVSKDFEKEINGFDPVKNGTIKLTSYAPDELVYKSSASSDQLAVFSEMYYGPDKGWQAYIDGVKAPHFRADYALRAMKVPQGDHEIKFKFEPRSYHIGEILSLIFSIFILLILGFGLYKWITKAEPTPAIAIADLGHKHAIGHVHGGSHGEKKLLRKKKKP
jgi:hypothetical protein